MYYIVAGGEIVAIFEKKTGAADAMHYVHTDHLGSLNVITNQSRAIEQELSFDAWGNRRNPDTWVNLTGTPANLITRRGFTAHEHIDEFGIINMNGRLYDPVLGRFLSPDPIIGDPGNTQSYNRYSYVVNNPLMFTDPSGYRTVPAWTTSPDGLAEPGGGSKGFYSWERDAFDWYDALWEARKDGYTGEAMNFINSYWEQTSDPNYNGTINVNYWQSSTRVVGKNNGQNLGEVMIVNTKVTMEVKWTVQTNDAFNNHSSGKESDNISGFVFLGVSISTEAGQALAKLNGKDLKKLQNILETNHNINSIRINNQILNVARVGKKIKWIGFVGNVAELGSIGIDVLNQGGEVTTKNVVDGIFAIVAFVPKVGWVISSIYSLDKEASKTGYYLSGDIMMW